MKGILQKRRDLEDCQKQLDEDNRMREAARSAISDKVNELRSAEADIQRYTIPRFVLDEVKPESTVNLSKCYKQARSRGYLVLTLTRTTPCIPSPLHSPS